MTARLKLFGLTNVSFASAAPQSVAANDRTAIAKWCPACAAQPAIARAPSSSSRRRCIVIFIQMFFFTSTNVDDDELMCESVCALPQKHRAPRSYINKAHMFHLNAHEVSRATADVYWNRVFVTLPAEWRETRDKQTYLYVGMKTLQNCAYKLCINYVVLFAEKNTKLYK